MNAQIRKERNAYYKILEQTQKGGLDISGWLEWFLQCLLNSFASSDSILEAVLRKGRFWSSYQLQSFNDRQLMMLNKLLDGFTGKLSSSKWAAMTKCSHDTALRDIQDLLRRNILRKEEAGGRSTHYVLP
jgi:Fic family protein